MKTTFYMQPATHAYADIALKSINWADAIEEVKATINYITATQTPAKTRNKRGISEYVEVYCGKLRKELSFADLRNPEIYQKVY